MENTSDKGRDMNSKLDSSSNSHETTENDHQSEHSDSSYSDSSDHETQTTVNKSKVEKADKPQKMEKSEKSYKSDKSNKKKKSTKPERKKTPDEEVTEQEDEEVYQKIEYPKLNFEEIEVNLRFIGDLKEDEKLMINDKLIQVDQRTLQSVRRWLSGDSRKATIDYIDHVINETKELTNAIVENIKNSMEREKNLEKLLKVQGLLTTAQGGLDKLLVTYGDDKMNKSRISMIKEKIRTFCDHDLKNSTTSI